MSVVKAVILGGFLTWLICLVFGTNHQSAGWLSVHSMRVAEYSVYWSWPLFVAASGLAWAIMAMMPSNR
jgi:hypothetical protein